MPVQQASSPSLTGFAESDLKAIADLKTTLGGEIPFDDACLLRFLVARQYNITKAADMVNRSIEWRNGVGADSIAFEPDCKLPVALRGYQTLSDRDAEPTSASEEQMFKIVGGHCVHKWSKDGSPIYIDRLGLLDTYGYAKQVSLETLDSVHIRTQELVHRVCMPEMSERLGHKVDKMTVIIDMAGLSLSQFHLPALMMVKHTSEIDQNNYPESLGRAFFINCPSIFTMFYNLGKSWVDPKTMSKVQFLGENYREALLEYIDAENLPSYLGGTCQCAGGCVPSQRLDRQECFYQHSRIVNARSSHREQVEITDENALLVYHFKTKNNDIQFGVMRRGDDGVEIPIIPINLVNSHKEPVQGSVRVSRGVYILVWDNKSSLLTSKALSYSFNVAHDANPTESPCSDASQTPLISTTSGGIEPLPSVSQGLERDDTVPLASELSA